MKGNKITFIAYNEFGGKNAKSVAEKIKTEREAGQKVIIFAHWGEEYTTPPRRVKEVAKLFAESGAFLIIGAHPHVIQEKEIMEIKEGGKARKVAIYYSLGNFIFDQYWNKEVSTGLALEVKIKGDNFDIIEHHVSINRDGTTCLR
jgi:poly-gamma-glutamate synthesis protein (capsule biosynthesis protein)